ncbi:hypothetical protein R50072_36840 [Simiduia litorea]|uniref:hypothetical protein n=1 Tax=Simiduia litorea TaxID=1435348 RepID=UPI0036F28845
MPMKDIAELNSLWLEHQNLMVLLPVLEHEYPAVIGEVKNAGALSENLLADVVEYSLRFPSRHWALLAVTWIENGFPLTSSICEQLLAISKDKTDSQKLRHKSLTQAKRWMRANSI